MTQNSDTVYSTTGTKRDEIMEKLEAAFEKIAAELNVPIDKVRNVANRHQEEPKKRGRPSLSNEVHQGRQEQIVELRREGWSNEDIAELLGLSYQTIGNMAHELIKKGLVTRQRRGKKPFSYEKREKCEEQIIKLRGEGFSNEDIAELLEMSKSTVSMWTHQLIEDGRTEHRWGKKGTCWDIKNWRVETIISMTKEKNTLQEIGNVLKVTRERARQLIKIIITKHGKEVFGIDNPLLTTRKVADILGVLPEVIKRLCNSGEVVCRHRGVNNKGAYLINKAELEKLKIHPAITHERLCEVCGEMFVYKYNQGSRKACSDKCIKELGCRKLAAYADQEPTLDSLNGWHKDLWQKLQDYLPPESEEYIGLKEAYRRTGLSIMQLVWLRHRNIVTSHPHPSKKWGGRPTMMYVVGEMEIARQVFEAYQN